MQHIGVYQVVDKLSQGGAAEVFRARDTRRGQDAPVVVIKQLTHAAEQDPDFLDRFLAEIDLCRTFDHPNVVRTLDFGVSDGRNFVVLDYIDGQNFESVLARARERQITFPSEFSLFVADEVLGGLDYAHHAKSATGQALHLVHRDISPHNIFVSYDGRVLLGDFGVALLPGLDDAAGQRVTMGKLGYLSPEQCFGEPVDQRTDVFAMAVVLAEALTGTRLFQAQAGEKDEDVMRRIGEGPRPNFGALNPKLPPGLVAVLERGLTHRPDARFASAAAMREALAPFIDPSIGNSLAIAALLRLLFKSEFEATRLAGSPLSF